MYANLSDRNHQLKAKTLLRLVPPSFPLMLRSITTSLIDSLSETATRTLSVHRVANPVLQLLLEFQSETDEGALTRDLLIDRILWGALSERAENVADRDAWVETLLRDQAGSHLFEKVLKFSNLAAFHTLFTRYFRGRLCRLIAHPIANHVVQQLFVCARTEVQLELMVEEVVEHFEMFLSEYLVSGLVSLLCDFFFVYRQLLLLFQSNNVLP